MARGKLAIKFSRGIRGHLIANYPSDMVIPTDYRGKK